VDSEANVARAKDVDLSALDEFYARADPRTDTDER
jgi:hypothetical protein